MTAVAAWREGMRRVSRAPVVLAGVWIVSLALVAPLAILLRDALAAHLGDSLVAESLTAGGNWDWWEEFSQQATGLGTTFVPSIIGFAAVLRNLSDLADNVDMPSVLVAFVGAWLVVWSFLSGGILDRLARNRPLGAPAFFQAAGGHFFRFLRLGIIAWVAYAILFGVVHGWLFEGFYAWATRDTTAERTAFAIRLPLYALFVALLAAVNVVVDYARIRIVVEDRRSAIAALAAAVRFAGRHRTGVVALYGLNTACFLGALALWAALAPGAGHAGLAQWGVFIAGQAYILVRLWIKLQFYASQTAFFQGALAHAEYAATSIPEWPESPAVESVTLER